MKSKRPSTTQTLGGSTTAQATARTRAAKSRAVVLDFVQSRIEAFNQAHGGGAGVRKDAHGYTLFRLDAKTPLARLRPRAAGDRFEVLYWSAHRDRWQSVGAFGGMILSLDDALEFIASDPMGCFWY